MIEKLKGKDLKDKVLVKILSEDLITRKFQYKLGKKWAFISDTSNREFPP